MEHETAEQPAQLEGWSDGKSFNLGERVRVNGRLTICVSKHPRTLASEAARRLWERARRHSRGFSLVEIAIVLVIIGMIVAGGLKGLDAATANNKVQTTNQRLETIQQALIVYAMMDHDGTSAISKGCLPCPADPATETGRSVANGTEYSGCSAEGSGDTCDHARGIVPWVNLGLSRDDIIDAWGTYIDYSLSTSPDPLNEEDAAERTQTPPIVYPTGELVVSNASADQQTAVAAYVLVSHGADRSGGVIPKSGGRQAPDPNSGGLQTCNMIDGTGYTACPVAGGGFVLNQRQGTNGTNGYFDDIIRYVTGPVFVQSCGSQGCGNT